MANFYRWVIAVIRTQIKLFFSVIRNNCLDSKYWLSDNRTPTATSAAQKWTAAFCS